MKARKLRWAGHVERIGIERTVAQVSGGKPINKRPLGRPRNRCKQNVRDVLKELGYDYLNWM